MVLSDAFYWATKTLFRVAFTLYNGLEVEGLGGILPQTTYIVASNHASYIDPPLLGGVFPGRLRYLAKDSLFENPVMRFLISNLGAIPVKREDSQRAGAVMKVVLERLAQGESFLLFPEGTRSKDGKLLPLEGGAAYLSVKSGVPLLPVYISGSSDAMPPHSSFPRPVRLKVTFGAPLFPDAAIAAEKQRRETLLTALDEALRSLERASGPR
ncbi:MAG: 1-acyl-sn-glycerol-3-phosphate acyltransferase [Synergistaceae bacterium]|jgi:1-acyl-sn-glycerol-3-phosphate acyltransferase|nr:1-acyl-sn-glycerol-3-phosphate acyltransferase [Synergistaceae bacterium]